jgi:hypothetical protein
MTPTVFISYARKDMEPTDWLDRLRRYLTPFHRKGAFDVWDDSRVPYGARWTEEIPAAIDSAQIALLFIGPGFFATDYIAEIEVPALLKAVQERSLKLFLLLVSETSYYAVSELGAFQAFNRLDHPLDKLPLTEQNSVLSRLAFEIDKAAREVAPASTAMAASQTSLRALVQKMQLQLADTRTAFLAQCERRDDLVAAIEARLNFTNDLEYEKFFFRYYDRLNDAERFEFTQIRAMTEGPLQNGNRNVLEIIECAPAILDAIPATKDLRQHLVFWLNKYDKVFSVQPAMCLLYTGVEDAVPFPENLDRTIEDWLANN